MKGHGKRSTKALVAGLMLTAVAHAHAQSVRPHEPEFSDPSVYIAPIEAFAEAGPVKKDDAFRGTGDPTREAGVLMEQPNVLEIEALPVMTADGPLSPSEAAAEVVLGFDSRVQVYTKTYPERAVALITFSGGRCTGWLYGKDVVATAGHCVHTGGSGGSWRKNVRVYPGYDADAAVPAPYGSCSAKWLGSVKGWTQSKKEAFDYGVVKLNCTVGNSTGWFGYFWTSSSLAKRPSIVSGYPGDKPYEQWWSSHRVGVSKKYMIFYLNDTIGGMSGSPVWFDRNACNGPCAMAIHAYGTHGSYPHNKLNHGPRIRKPVFNNLKNWKSAP